MYKAHIVSHTHWDREWYKPFQHFRVRLIYFLDKLMDVLEENEDYKVFTLDGQTSLLEDYLKIKPQNSERLKNLIKNGRILIGPWYIQPDEFSPDGESLVRNLLIGDRMGEEFESVMKVGYLPDSFGQSSQIPQILLGFDIDCAVMMRGIPFHLLGESEFIWEGLNGDSILAVYLAEGYFNGCFLPKDLNKADMRINPLVGKLKESATTKNLLIMNGIDHQFPQEHIPEYIKYLNERSEKVEYIHSSMDKYVDSIKSYKEEMKSYKGEMITPERSRTHTSMASTRMYQKKENRKVEVLLEKYVEPIVTLAWLNGAKYPKELINQSWKYLIQNQAHDSICGCCTDEVHKEIDQRFIDCKNIGETLLNSHARAIARKFSKDKLKLIVFNNAMILNLQLVKASIIIDSKDFIMKDEDGNIIPYEIEKIEDVNAASLGIWASMTKVTQTKKKVYLSFYTTFDSNFGYRVFDIVERKNNALKKTVEKEIKYRDNILENKYFKIYFNKNGSFNVVDKESNREYKNLNIYENCGDDGDTYNFSPVKNDSIVTSESNKAKLKLIKKDSIKTTILINNELEIPLKLDSKNNSRSKEIKTLNINTYVTIYSKIKRIDVRVDIENYSYDHRLRVLFPTTVKSDYSFAETQFGTVKRPNKLDDTLWDKNSWSEKPLPIYTMHRFVDINDSEYGLAVLNKGINEYEIYENNEAIIAITLLRAVGNMGKRELLIRPGRASGMEIETSDAQCIGKHEFEYSIIPHIGDAFDANIPASAAQFDADPFSVQNILKLNNTKEEIELYDIETLTKHIENEIDILNTNNKLISLNDDRILISAIKRCEDEDNFIIRIYNSSSKAITNGKIGINIDGIEKAVLTDFNECNIKKELEREKNYFQLPKLKAFTAETIKFVLN
ncbi:glycoside hydrolase family 38 N-terminal domain-containing protein [Maledivibacter halophilus]|uniref:Mannosylglycerate hydrolase n=1 Tax=Maledivibacter halophilus TaxID=36842 RepID=A0A1T5IBB6_9FIRM|nr:glycoside hydrolase family 38 C-terminal domain-containing protein [Maledivibacter halophilus]SKC36437.1 mannosylglycerate hydrolase [Maledivibacter halophilus]